MKYSKVKGFTLIELIVVLATFSVIMFGALNLMQPVRKIFLTTYNQETISASTDNIKRYLESSIRYAEYVRFQEAAPTNDDLVSFIDDYYNGMLIGDGATQHYVNGDIYVMKVDNLAGGKISLYRYEYQAGDKKDLGIPNPASADTTQKFLDSHFLVNADTDDIPTVVSSAPLDSTEWAVNKAMYDDYHFNISLGQYELDVDHLVQSAAFAKENVVFTITAYPYNPAKGINRQMEFDENGIALYYKYDPAYIRAASMGLNNCLAQRKYFQYSWKYNETSNDTMRYDLDGSEYVTDAMIASGTKKIPYKETTVSESPFVTDGISNFMDPDVFYIIYTYSGNTVIK